MKETMIKRYKKSDIMETLMFITDFQECLKKRKGRLRKNLDKKTYRLYKELKKDLKTKYKDDVYLCTLIKQIPSIFWLSEYIFIIIFVSLYFVLWHIVVYRLAFYFADYFIILVDWNLDWGFLIIRLMVIFLLGVWIWRLMDKVDKLSTSIFEIQKVLEEYKKSKTIKRD
jgi:hypothetical protein